MDFTKKQHGFTLRYSQELPEIGATLYRLEYEKNGADLIWLDRPDDNKTFSITFKTIPQDDTGVFHILEHSVLNGSVKYPVKEPFVELLKSSLQTFLNAMTFPDKTMYPVSSRNDQDFLNLMDVYMDAVLHPLSISDPHAFLQEGWHYELEDPEGELTCNGVVYSEMKGAYADPDATLSFELDRALFPDNCYGFESGGHPRAIPTLTYDNYLACHKRFYHPSNARIFLDGQVDMDAALARLDSFLQDYDRLNVDADIPLQQPVSPETRIASYEISETDDPESKVLLSKGWVFSTFADKGLNLTAAILSEILAGSNEAPLKKALLRHGLGKEVELSVQSEVQQPYMVLRVHDTTEKSVQQIWDTVDTVLQEQIQKGLDKNRLHAILNNLEFSSREKDFGSIPKGLCYAILSQEAWLYGGDPAQGLCEEAAFPSLREKIDTGWFEDFIQTCLLDNPHTAQVVLLPSKTLGQERKDREKARLAQVKASWSREDCEQVISTFEKLRQRQNTPDSPEQLATLPQLALSDIQEKISHIPQAQITQVGQTTVLLPEVNTNGIVYLTLYFSLDDIPVDNLSAVSFLCRLLGQLETQNYSPLELRSQVQGNLGRLSASAVSYYRKRDSHTCKPCLAVSVSALESKKADVTRLLSEILLTTRFADRELILNILSQDNLGMEQDISMSGNAYAARRIAAEFSAQGNVTEQFDGIDKLRWLQKTYGEYDRCQDETIALLEGLWKQIFVRERLTINLAGGMDQGWLEEILNMLPSGQVGATTVKMREQNNGGFTCSGYQIPAEVGFVAKASHLSVVDAEYSGVARVAAQYLTYDYLWNAVRVKGGAYGVRLGVLSDGNIRFASYRDPNTDQTLDTYDHSGEILRKLVESGTDIDKYVISSIGEMQPIMTPRTEAHVAASYYFTGTNPEEIQALYSQILHTTPQQLEAFSHVLDRASQNAGVCIISGKTALEECGVSLDLVEDIHKEYS